MIGKEISKLSALIVDIIHTGLLFFPLFIYLTNKVSKRVIIWMVLASAYVPASWLLFDNECILSTLSSKLDSNTASFSERYLLKFYNKIRDQWGFEKNENGTNRVILYHWLLNMFAIWYYIFFYKKFCK